MNAALSTTHTDVFADRNLETHAQTLVHIHKTHSYVVAMTFDTTYPNVTHININLKSYPHHHVSFSSFTPLHKHTFILAYLNSKTTHIYSAVCHSGMHCTFTIISLTTHSRPAKHHTHTHTHTLQFSCSPKLCQILLTAADTLSLQLL